MRTGVLGKRQASPAGRKEKEEEAEERGRTFCNKVFSKRDQMNGSLQLGMGGRRPLPWFMAVH